MRLFVGGAEVRGVLTLLEDKTVGVKAVSQWPGKDPFFEGLRRRRQG